MHNEGQRARFGLQCICDFMWLTLLQFQSRNCKFECKSNLVFRLEWISNTLLTTLQEILKMTVAYFSTCALFDNFIDIVVPAVFWNMVGLVLSSTKEAFSLPFFLTFYWLFPLSIRNDGMNYDICYWQIQKHYSEFILQKLTFLI